MTLAASGRRVAARGPTSTLSGLIDRLEKARGRSRALRLANAAIVALASGLAAFLLLELLRRLLPTTWLGLLVLPIPGEDLGFNAGIAGIVALAVLVGTATIAILRAPGIDRLARRADTHFGLLERISTTIEVERDMRGGRRPAVVNALISDVSTYAQRIDPGDLIALRLSRVVYVAAALAAAVALIVLVPTPTRPVPMAERTLPSAELGSQERAAVADDIRRVADLVEQEAQSRSDRFMQAVANTLRDLGERVATSPTTMRDDVLGELAVLSDYAAMARSEWQGDAGERIPQLISALSQSVTQPLAQSAGPQGPSSDQPAPGDPTGDPASAPTVPAAGAPAEPFDTLLADMERYAAMETNGAAQPADQPVVASDYFSVAEAQNAERLASGDNAAPAFEDAQLLGPAADARAGDSLLAGKGTDPIGATPVQPSDIEIAANAEMILRSDDAGAGRRLELQVTPNTSFTQITEQGLAASANAWRHLEEAAVARDLIGLEDREAVSRYLRALANPPVK